MPRAGPPCRADAAPIRPSADPRRSRAAGRDLRAAGGREARCPPAAGAPLHLCAGLAAVGQPQPRRQCAGARGAAAGGLARAVAVPRSGRQWAIEVLPPAACSRTGLRGIRRLGARRAAGAAGAGSARRGTLPAQLRSRGLDSLATQRQAPDPSRSGRSSAGRTRVEDACRSACASGAGLRRVARCALARRTNSGRKLRRLRSAKATVTCVALASSTTPRP
jgi:hypothetical protein